MAQTDNIKLISNNKKAYHDFFIEEKFEAGMELYGTEIKSVRMGNVNLKDSWISIKNLEAFVMGMHISPYEKGNIFNKDPLRIRKLLLLLLLHVFFQLKRLIVRLLLPELL